MRRRKRDLDDLPAHLRSFEPVRWGKNSATALRAWTEARKAYWSEHPGAWRDFISLMAGPANVRARRMGRNAPYPLEDEGQP